VRVTASSRPRWLYLEYPNYGPIIHARPEDQWEISSLIQRGQAVTDERLAAQALAYARFRVRVLSVLALLYLAWVGYLASRVSFGSLLGIASIMGCTVFLAASVMFAWLAVRCRRGARATAQARVDRR
jgi:hypothetical protein